MGTRNLTMVKYNNEMKVAQYGQWDGYPTGQGQTIIDFLLKKDNIENLKENLKKVRFIDSEGKDKNFIKEYQKNTPEWSNEPDNRTPEQKHWFETYCDRDLGANILFNISNSEDKEILLKNCEEFLEDGLMCEWAYTLDLDNNILIVYKSIKEVKRYNFKDLNNSTMEKLESELNKDEK